MRSTQQPLQRLAVSLAALAALTIAPQARAADAAEVVMTAQGPVQATVRGDMRTYFAIPFAAPPVGDLRWKPPQPAAKWTATLARTKTGAACLQTGPDSPFRTRGDSEDCLYLDVYVPPGTAADAKLPVLVWIFGGGYSLGAYS